MIRRPTMQNHLVVGQQSFRHRRGVGDKVHRETAFLPTFLEPRLGRLRECDVMPSGLSQGQHPEPGLGWKRCLSRRRLEDSTNRIKARRVGLTARSPGRLEPAALVMLIPGVDQDGVGGAHGWILLNELE